MRAIRLHLTGLFPAQAGVILQDLVTEDGESVGTLEDILETPASQIYVVKGETEHLIPAVDEFIVRVDAENAVVTVRLIEGM